ncbi:MAG TPA: hypothetical protein VFV87_16680 [Pirellulaceae bacterium]|nr:hypothetical protein [Pirellulaceae bacterium]
MRFRLRTLLIALAVLPPILAVVGVALFDLKQEPPSVVGRVTFRGMPADAVAVVFSPPDAPARSYAAKTDAAGMFRVTADSKGRPLRAGSYRVSISGQALPARYQNPTTSGLAVEVSGPETTLDFELQ